LRRAVADLARSRSTPAQAKRRYELETHLARYLIVRDLHDGMSWEKARAQASKMLAGTPYSGTAPTMKASYDQVARDLKAGRHGKYHDVQGRVLLFFERQNQDRARTKQPHLG
jgi:hypothetical protein